MPFLKSNLPFTFRAKLLASHVGLVGAVVLIVILELNRALGSDLERQLDQRLQQEAEGAAAWVGEGRRHPDKLAGRIALIVNARATIFDREGSVLGDSLEKAAVATQSGEPPEVRAAQRGDIGRATRLEGSEEVHYVAVAAGDGLVLRLSEPISNTKVPLRSMRRRLLFASGLAVLAALALGLLASRIAARPLRDMTRTATAIARGDYRTEEPSASPDEFGILSRALAELATQLKRQVGDLTAERDRLSAILAGMVEGVLVVGKDARVVLANPAAATVLGAQGRLEGRSLGEVVKEDRVRTLLESGIERGEAAEAEIESGQAEEVRSIAAYVRPLGGGIVAVLRDMTHVRRLLSLRRDFVANVSHELQTPVTAISGYAETLLRGTPDAATQRQFLEIIHRQSRRIGALVEGLLRLSELDARPLEAEPPLEPVDVGAVARNAAETVRERAAAAGVTVTLDVPGGSGAPVPLLARGDATSVEQVLENLVDNAIKYGKRRGEIVVRARRDGGSVVVSVADDGPGIAAHHLPRLFERFYRVDPGRSRDRGGSGLGLAIVKHLVESMGGAVGVESVVGGGTTFTITLGAAS
jgi:two-component system phosphate regulon sensor histidine kinase PhoR